MVMLREALERIIASKLPAVLINGMDCTMRLNSVLPDNWSAGWLATHRLSLRRRLEGFRVALEEAGIRFDPQRHVLDLSKFGVQESQTQQVVRQVLQDGSLADTTAFFCSRHRSPGRHAGAAMQWRLDAQQADSRYSAHVSTRRLRAGCLQPRRQGRREGATARQGVKHACPSRFTCQRR